MTDAAVIGVNICKMSFCLIAVDAVDATQWKKKVSRPELMRRMAGRSECLVRMGACRGAHRHTRELIALGPDVRLMASQFVKAFLNSNKNDYSDAKAIAEAVQRPTMRLVTVESVEQLDLQAPPVREQLVSRKTAVIDQIRAFLLESFDGHLRDECLNTRWFPSF